MKNQNGFVPIIILAVILVVAVIGGGAYFYVSNKSHVAAPSNENDYSDQAPMNSQAQSSGVFPNNESGQNKNKSATENANQNQKTNAKAGVTVNPPAQDVKTNAGVIAENQSTAVGGVSKTSSATWTAGTQWVNIPSINGKAIKAAVTWPDGSGPFPVVILLHGSEGFRQTYVSSAQSLSKHGFITIAACWFTGFKAPLANFIDYIDCPSAPTFTGTNLNALSYLDPVISYAKSLPGSNGKVGMIGSSRGSTMSLLAAEGGENINATVSVSAIYEYPKAGINDTLPITMADKLSVPLLILHGTGDSIVNIQEAKDYVSKLTTLGKTFDYHYYVGAPHQILYTEPYATDVLNRASDFFNQYLK